jgi:uncharacterized RDD family membrane protein YckC
MKKITELTETVWRTKYYKDANGNRLPKKEQFTRYLIIKAIKPGPRFGHFIIDLICLQILNYVFNYICELSLQISSNLNLTISLFILITKLLLCPVFYFFFEYNWQRTPGKFLTKCRVINEYAEKPDLRQTLLRSLLRLVPFEAFSCFADKYSVGWHDRWSKTVVVPDEEIERIKKIKIEQENLDATKSI